MYLSRHMGQEVEFLPESLGGEGFDSDGRSTNGECQGAKVLPALHKTRAAPNSSDSCECGPVKNCKLI